MSNYNIDYFITHIHRYYMSILIFAIASLAVAYFVEYVLGFEPCILCLYQRIPYYLLVIFAGFGLGYDKKIVTLLMGIIFASSILLSGYHTLIERELIGASSTCNPDLVIPDKIDAQSFRDMIYSREIATCTKPPFKVFGFSMTEWNLGVSVVFFIINILIYKKQNDA
jgi:disulfide bond formation protein DsbB